MYDVILGAEERTKNGEMSAPDFEELQKALGFNANTLGLLAAHDLRAEFKVSNVLVTDSVHDALQDGMLNIDTTLLFVAGAGVGVTFEMWGRYFKANWSYPKHRRLKTGDLHELFDKFYSGKKPSKDQKFKCQASQLLTVFGMVRHVVESKLEPSGRLQPQCASFKGCMSNHRHDFRKQTVHWCA